MKLLQRFKARRLAQQIIAANEQTRELSKEEQKLLAEALIAEPTQEPLQIPMAALMRSRRRAREDIEEKAKLARRIFRPAAPPPGVVPEGAVMALDANAPGAATTLNVLGWASQLGYNSAFQEGTTFLGYAYLSELAQRAEYRVMSEELSSEMTREWIELKTTGDESKDEKIQELTGELRRLNVQAVFAKAALHDGFFGRGHIYIDTGDTDDPDELKMSIGSGDNALSKAKVNKTKPVLALRNVEPVWVYPTQYDSNDPLKADWYKPTHWFVMGKQLHSSRLLTFIGREVPDLLKPAYAFGGLSMSQMAKPYVDNWLRTRQSVADIIQAFSVMVLKTDLGTLLQNGGDQIFARLELFNNFRNNKSVMAVDKNTEDFANVSAPLSGLHELQAQTQEHMCLAGDTLIWTDRGQIPIKDVRVTDRAMTRKGWAPIVWAGATGHAKELIEFHSSDAVLRATECHPIFLPEINEFVPARNVGIGDRLSVVPTKTINTEDQSFGAAVGGRGRAWDITETLEQEDYSIASFGRRIKGLFPKAMMYITGTKIARIISSPILNLKPVLSTTSNTCETGVWGSIDSQRHGKRFVSSVEPHTKHLGIIRRIIAVIYVTRKLTKNDRESSRARTAIQERALNAACRFMPFLRESVGSIVARNARPKCITAAIEAARKIATDETVYNLEIAEGFLPEFFANGILVHNCSVARIPVVKLLGIQPAGLNASSEGEIRAFYDWVAAFQESLFRENLQSVIDFAMLSLWGEIDEDITFEFVDMWQLDAVAQAALEKTKTDIDDANVAMGSIDAEVVRERLVGDPKSQYKGIDLQGVEQRMQDQFQSEEQLDLFGNEPDAETHEPETGAETPPAQTHARDPSDRLATSVENRAARFGSPATGGFKGDAAFEEGKHPRGEGGKFAPAKEIPFEASPDIGWWREGDHLNLYHGTHVRNVPSIAEKGITHKDPTSGMISMTLDPHTAHGYASMSGIGGEHNFRKTKNVRHTPHEERAVLKYKVPREWIDENIDSGLHGNLGAMRDKMQDRDLFTRWRRDHGAGYDPAYYATSELRFKKEIPPEFLEGVMRRPVKPKK